MYTPVALNHRRGTPGQRGIFLMLIIYMPQDPMKRIPPPIRPTQGSGPEGERDLSFNYL